MKRILTGLCLLSTVLWCPAQQTTALVDASTGELKRPTASLFASANNLLGTGGDLSYTSPTLSVPAGFGITGAGSLAFTAGGTNQSVTLTPTDSASAGPVSFRLLPAAAGAAGGFPGAGLFHQNSAATFPGLGMTLFRNGFSGQAFFYMGAASGTSASPATTGTSGTIGGYRWYAYANGAWRNVGNVSVETSSTFGDSDFTSVMRLGPSTSVGQGNLISMIGAAAGFFGSTVIGGATTSSSVLLVDAGGNGSSPAWGTTGEMFAVAGRTITDTTSSVTAATAVANSFAVPTFSTPVSVTYTNLANVYIAGDVATAGSASATNSYGLWNVGKTRLDGPITFTPSALTYASPTSVNVALATVYTVTTVNATGSVTFNATGAGRAGQPMWIIITNDATSAKTITFGTNFAANGTLTASGVNKRTTIQFISDGAAFVEVGRTVLP